MLFFFFFKLYIKKYNFSYLQNIYIQINNIDNMVKKVKILLDEDVVNRLIKLKRVGVTYSDIIKKLLNEAGNDENKDN